MQFSKLHLHRGISLVEVVISTAIILFFLTALIGVHNIYLRIGLTNSSAIKAAFLAEEGVEAVRFLRDASWEDNIEVLDLDTDYFLAFSSNAWALTTDNVYIDDTLERVIQFDPVYRDAEGHIVTSGGSLDEGILLVRVLVSWAGDSATTTRSVSTYLTNF